MECVCACSPAACTCDWCDRVAARAGGVLVAFALKIPVSKLFGRHFFLRSFAALHPASPLSVWQPARTHGNFRVDSGGHTAMEEELRVVSKSI